MINWVQAAALGPDPDEAYYWFYAQHLDWGYFDHPPMIALLIFLGKSLFAGTLGLRFFIPVLSAGCLLLLWDLLDRPASWRGLLLLIALFTAMPLLQVYAFVATPDAPLLFFSVLFLWVYRRFITKPTYGLALFWGLVMAALLYSKYHGILLIFFTLFSNWRLLRDPRFYLAGFFGALLFLPHLYWQYSHDFPSFRYHLSGRDDPYELKHTFNYLLNQLLIFSPLLFPMIGFTLWRRKAADIFERALRFNVFGFWAFFFYTTFKGHVEPQWTVILSLAFIILLHRHHLDAPRRHHWLLRLALMSSGLLLIARIVIAWPDTGLKTPFNRNGWVAGLEAATGAIPLVFQDSYRYPSVYQFYTGRREYTFTDNCYRHNQYDIYDWEQELHNRTVWMVGNATWKNPDAQTLQLPGNTLRIKKVDSLQISQKVQLEVALPDAPWKIGDSLRLEIHLSNPYPHDIYPARGGMPLTIKERYSTMDCLDDSSWLRLIDPPEVWPAGKTIVLRAVMLVPTSLPAGHCDFSLCIQTGDLPPAFAGRPVKVQLVR